MHVCLNVLPSVNAVVVVAIIIIIVIIIIVQQLPSFIVGERPRAPLPALFHVRHPSTTTNIL
jgi:hypothetical protein